MNKFKHINNVNAIDNQFQPSVPQVNLHVEENKNDLSNEDYEKMLKSINLFNSRLTSNNPYLDKNLQSYEWEQRPHVTRPVTVLAEQLRFYDELKSKNILSKQQELVVDQEIKKIFNELKTNEEYAYFLKHGVDFLKTDKNELARTKQLVKFYQRDDDIEYDNLKEDYIDIKLPENKWWISSEAKGNFSIVKDSSYNENSPFVNIDAKLANTYNADNYLDEIVIKGVNYVKETTNDSSIYEYNQDNQNNNLSKEQSNHKEISLDSNDKKNKQSFFSKFKKQKETKKEVKQDNNNQVVEVKNLPPINKTNQLSPINLNNKKLPPIPNKPTTISVPQPKNFFDYQNKEIKK